MICSVGIIKMIQSSSLDLWLDVKRPWWTKMRWRWRAEVNVCRLVSMLAVHCDKCSAHPLSSSSNSPSKPSTLLHLLFVCSSFRPPHHPSLPWLAVVSCREAMNNSSRRVVLPSLAPHFRPAVALKHIWRRARSPAHTAPPKDAIDNLRGFIDCPGTCMFVEQSVILLKWNIRCRLLEGGRKVTSGPFATTSARLFALNNAGFRCAGWGTNVSAVAAASDASVRTKSELRHHTHSPTLNGWL